MSKTWITTVQIITGIVNIYKLICLHKYARKIKNHEKTVAPLSYLQRWTGRNKTHCIIVDYEQLSYEISRRYKPQKRHNRWTMNQYHSAFSVKLKIHEKKILCWSKYTNWTNPQAKCPLELQHNFILPLS